MDIIHLLPGTAAQTPLTGKPAGNAEPGAQFASVLEDATNVHGTPKGLTLLAAIPAPRVAATMKDAADQALRAKLAPADLLASKDAKPEGKDAPKADPKDAQKSEDQDVRKPGKQAAGDDKGKHAHADAATPDTPIAAAINAALAAVAAQHGQTAAAGAGKGTASGQRAADAAPGKIANADTRGAGSRHQLQQLQQTPQAVSSAATSGHTGTDAGAAGNGQGFASQLLSAADASSHANAPAHADNGAASSAINGLLSMNAAPQAASHATAPAMVPTATLQAPIGSMPWQNELGQQLIRFSQRGDQQIELHLHPKELGPLQISLHVNDQVAQAHFFAAHAQVRDAVQQAIPQLREALAGQGIALGEAMVGQQQRQDSGSSGGSSSSPSFGGATEVESITSARPVASVLPRIGVGGVDLYA
ncbi:MAG TPA: flagellar hook-length control protein FliK [Rhodanobacteraceae bacterium]|nr:flagellar hook-length control protein FliK [Rhodanobacteraceae bacterium]